MVDMGKQDITLANIHARIEEEIAAILAEDGVKSQPSPMETTKAFTKYYVSEIAEHIDKLSDKEAVDRGLECDGANDLGCDFIYAKSDEENEFWIYQTKYRGKKSNLKRGDLTEFFDTRHKVFSDAEREKANETVKDLLRDVTKSSSIIFVFLTNKRADNLRSDFERLKEDAQKEYPNCDWKLVDLSEIKANYKRLAQSVDPEDIKIKVPVSADYSERPFGDKQTGISFFDLSKGAVMYNDDEYRTLVTVVKGTELNNWYQEYSNALFSYNIRGFLGNRGKNKILRETLADEGKTFYLFNNGISAICEEFVFNSDKKGLSVECKGFQIINGAQTVSSIHEFATSETNVNKLRDVLVLMRVTETGGVRSKGLNDKVIKYNNSQNVIRDADFRSNDPIQTFLETEFRKKNFQYKQGDRNKTLVYMPKRMYKKPDRTKALIKMDEFAKSLYTFKYDDPGKIYSQTAFLFDDSQSSGFYWKLFGRQNEDGEWVSRDDLNSDEVREFASIAILSIYFDDVLKKEQREYDANLVEGMVCRARRFFLWGVGHVIRAYFDAEERQTIYRKIIDGKAFDKDNGFVPKVETLVREAIFLDLSERNDPDAEETLNFKSWLRRKGTADKIARHLRFHKSQGKIPPA